MGTHRFATMCSIHVQIPDNVRDLGSRIQLVYLGNWLRSMEERWVY